MCGWRNDLWRRVAYLPGILSCPVVKGPHLRLFEAVSFDCLTLPDHGPYKYGVGQEIPHGNSEASLQT